MARASRAHAAAIRVDVQLRLRLVHLRRRDLGDWLVDDRSRGARLSLTACGRDHRAGDHLWSQRRRPALLRRQRLVAQSRPLRRRRLSGGAVQRCGAVRPHSVARCDGGRLRFWSGDGMVCRKTPSLLHPRWPCSCRIVFPSPRYRHLRRPASVGAGFGNTRIPQCDQVSRVTDLSPDDARPDAHRAAVARECPRETCRMASRFRIGAVLLLRAAHPADPPHRAAHFTRSHA